MPLNHPYIKFNIGRDDDHDNVDKVFRNALEVWYTYNPQSEAFSNDDKTQIELVLQTWLRSTLSIAYPRAEIQEYWISFTMGRHEIKAWVYVSQHKHMSV